MALADHDDFVHIYPAMNGTAQQMRGLLAWLALVAYLLLGTSAGAGVVTCFGFDGHIATERAHLTGSLLKTTSGAELAGNHGPCFDVGLENPAAATQQKACPRSDAGPAKAVWAIPSFAPRVASFFHHVVWPAAPPCGGAQLQFADTVRLLI